MPTVRTDRAPEFMDDARPPALRIAIVIASVMVIATKRLGRALLMPVTLAWVLTSC